MKTLEQIKINYKSETLDGRDLARLAEFLPLEMWEDFGLKPKLTGDRLHRHAPKEFTKENVLLQLKKDVEFGFEKALNQCGISSSWMYEVVGMWNWILEEGLENFDNYSMYGLPLFKATAVKYGFDNPIVDDTGSEAKYDSRNIVMNKCKICGHKCSSHTDLVRHLRSQHSDHDEVIAHADDDSLLGNIATFAAVHGTTGCGKV